MGKDSRRMPFTAIPLSAVFLLLVAVSGCQEEGPNIVPVSGTITLNGKPLKASTISFWSDAFVASGETDLSGHYELTPGALPGEYKVTIIDIVRGAAFEPALPDALPEHADLGQQFPTLPAKYYDIRESDLTFTVEEPGTDSANFDLTVP